MAYQVGTVNLEPPHTSLLSEEALAPHRLHEALVSVLTFLGGGQLLPQSLHLLLQVLLLFSRLLSARIRYL